MRSKLMRGDYGALLESARVGTKIGRYSIIAATPELIFKGKGDLFHIAEGKSESSQRGNPVSGLQELMKRRSSPKLEGLPNFTGGAIGYLGYDARHYFEVLSRRAQDDLELPDIFFLVCDSAVVFDHLADSLYIISNIDLTSDTKLEIDSAKERIYRVADILLNKYYNIYDDSESFKTGDISYNFERAEFEKAVRRVKEYIRAGDVYQVNLSQRLAIEFEGDSWHLYRALRDINPSPFACYLKLEDIKIASSSPERLVKLFDDRVQTRPIAGTQKRGKDQKEDEKIGGQLLLDQKERAEHIMLVDLERNDIGRVCRYGSVSVDELMTLERYSHVTHIVSNICGTLQDRYTSFELIRAVFPGGTITGCPKIRCMEIIDELEPTTRNIYTGSVGYFSYNGDCDFNIVIRTLVLSGGQAYLQVGAGIVADSSPEREYIETMYKAAGLVEAIIKRR